MTAAARPPAYPFQELLGFRKTGYAEDYARFELAISPRFGNRVGIPHGGVYAALLDCALGGAGCWMGNDDDIRPAVTLNLSINFVSAPKGERLIAEGRRIGGGKKVYYSEGALRDETGHLLCSATGVFRYVG